MTTNIVDDSYDKKSLKKGHLFDNVFTEEQISICPILSVVKFVSYEIKGGDFRISNLDIVDFTKLVMDSESLYDEMLWDTECDLMDDFTIDNLNELFIFIKGGECSDFIKNWIFLNNKRIYNVRKVYINLI